MGASQSTGPLSQDRWACGPSEDAYLSEEAKSGHKGDYRGGMVVNITKVEFHIRPRTPYSSAVCVRGQSGRDLVITGPRNYVTTEDGITDQG